MSHFASRSKNRLSRALGIERLETRAVPATYIVATTGDDRASGLSENNALQTIQHALDLARSPGDVVVVRGGVYHEQVTFRASGSAAGAIVLKNYGSEKPILDGTGLAGGNMISIFNRSYVQVSGFEIRNNLGVTDGSGIRIQGSGAKIVIRNNVIHDIRGRNGMGITVYGTSTAQPISGLIVDRNEIYASQPAPSEALTINGNVTGFRVTRNLVHDVNNIGIDVIGGEMDINPDPRLVARNGLVRGNTVYNARSNYGGGYGAGIYVDGGRNIVVENNTSYQNDMGIEIGAENAGTITRGIIVRNNIVHHNDKAGIVLGGFARSVGRVQDSFFVNNTVAFNDTLGDGNGQLWIQYASGNVITNNVFVATANNLLVTTTVGDVNNVVDYNLYNAPAGASNVQILWHDRNFTTFAGYRSASGDDQHSRFTNPGFAANYHLAADSPAIDAGTAQPGRFAPLDRAGVARPIGAKPDLGAFEFQPVGSFAAVPVGLTPAQRRRADQLVSVFENDTIVIRYDYIENIQDGRGFTAGRAGFTTATGDLLEVVERYTALVPGNELAKFLPRLRELARAQSAATTGLNGIVAAWKSSAADPVFRGVQDGVVNQEYFEPARKRWQTLGLRSALSLAILYDTIIQHGGGNDPDGLPAIIRRTNAALGGSPASGVGPNKWVSKFLDIRYQVLSNATDPATRVGWRESRPRVDVLRMLVKQGNWDLHGPIRIPGTHYTAVTIS